MIRILLIIITTIFLYSCSLTSNPKPSNFEVEELNFYIEMPIRNKNDYERYRVVKNYAFQECGQRLDEKLLITEQNLSDLDNQSFNKLMDSVWNILLLTKENKALAQHYKSSELGFANFNINSNQKKFMVDTTFTAILNPQTPLEFELNKIIKLIRSRTKSSACGNKHFHGL